MRRTVGEAAEAAVTSLDQSEITAFLLLYVKTQPFRYRYTLSWFLRCFLQAVIFVYAVSARLLWSRLVVRPPLRDLL